LNLWGYYDGITSVTILKDGFEDAYLLIDKIKPTEYVDLPLSSTP